MAPSILSAALIVSLLVSVLADPLLIRQVTQSSDNHLIVELPGAPASVSFAQYSGYITVDEQTGRSLFYWFVEADLPDPTSAPLTLWLNGGPGCSSVGGGLLSELGPFHPDKDGTHLHLNPYSWNKVSNIIFLESPAGVGFSYSNSTEDYITGDARTAEDSYIFLKKFWQIYPSFAQSSFFLAGESYAGHYIPQLAALIIKNQQLEESSIKFKGMAVGNPWTDIASDAYGSIFYWWTHALISDEIFHGIIEKCKFLGQEHKRTEEDLSCDELIAAANKNLESLNIYDIYVDVCLPPQAQAQAGRFLKQLNKTGHAGTSAHPIVSSSYDPCIENKVETYLNRADVQAAIHANMALPYPWKACSDVLDYSSKDMFTSVLPTYRTLLQSGIEIFVFSGDVDAKVPVTSTRLWISKLNLTVTKSWRPWFLERQVGGYVTEYAGLTFATVRNAGHMVPYTQPARALHLFHSFITKTSL